MRLADIPFSVTDWAELAPTEHPGETGVALWRTREFGEIRIRMVEYSAGYLADHWCDKGHIILCTEGEFAMELKDGRVFTLTPGVSCQMEDNGEPHRSFTKRGARLFIVD